MQIPPQIAFHNIDKSDWAESAILDHIARLDQIYDRLTTCRVRVERRADNSKHTIPPVVRIELSVPGYNDLVVAHEPDRLMRNYQNPDLHKAINEAFRLAEDQLAAHKARVKDRPREAAHHYEHLNHGQVAELTPGEDFGFVLTRDGGLLYFHRNSMVSGDFDSLQRGDELLYVESMGDTGPMATKVRVKENNGGPKPSGNTASA